MFLEALQDILVDHAGSAAIRAIEAGGRGVEVWQPIEDAGFLALMLPESQGGAALPLSELFPILDCLGRHALPLPVAQSIVARALVGEGAELPPGMLTLGLQWQRQPDGGMACLHTPAGMVAEHVLVADTDRLLLLALSDARREPVGDPRSLVAHLYWREARPVQEWVAGGTSLAAHAAALTAAQLSGAMQRIFAMALDQCNTRVQFGKSISKFQAVQQQLSRMAEHVAATCMAAEAAFQPGPDGQAQWLQAAIAKARCSEAAVLVADTAHALHGAIGVTQEYDLQLYTRRLRAWRVAHGSEAHWNQRIGEQVLAGSASVLDTIRG